MPRYSVTNNSPHHRIVYHAGKSGGTPVPMKGTVEIEMSAEEAKNAEAPGVEISEVKPKRAPVAERRGVEAEGGVPQPGGSTVKQAAPGEQLPKEPAVDTPAPAATEPESTEGNTEEQADADAPEPDEFDTLTDEQLRTRLKERDGRLPHPSTSRTTMLHRLRNPE